LTCSNNSEFSISSVPSQAIATLTSRIGSMQFGQERELDEYLKRERRPTLTQEDILDSSIIFENSESKNHSNDPPAAKSSDDSPKATKTTFRKLGENSDSTDDEIGDIEEILRVDDIPRVEIAEALDLDNIVINEDFVLFIKMTPYPLTLYEFIVSRAFKWEFE
jgi:eukaryotic translation initiation factor 2-alpha kinase 3